MKKTAIRNWAVRTLGSRLLLALGATWKVRIIGDCERSVIEGHVPFIYAFFHSRLLVPTFTHRRRGVAIMVSRHGDGEMIHGVLTTLGFRSIRGSSTRGGAKALLEMKDLPPDVPLAITPDGPRGPAEAVQPGAAWLASRTGRVLLPGDYACNSLWRLRSWDRFMIPKPFSTIHIVFGEPMHVSPDLTLEDVPAVSEELGRRIAAARAEAEASLR
jgi:lysophospholipid acyltransferase (LPLAT)-like uncharacterized protein